MRVITEFEVDPSLVAEAIQEGRNLRITVQTDGRTIYKKCTLGVLSKPLPGLKN
jgi:hypothetical protein